MRLTRDAKEEAVEMLRYLAAEDPLLSLRHAKGAAIDSVRALLKNVAQYLEEDLHAERGDGSDVLSEGVSSQARQIISTLSPREERLLFKSFKLNG